MIIKKYQLFLEAFLSKDKENAVEQIISYITRNSNVDLYPYNELFYIQKENLFLTGQLFLSLKTSKAIRINWIDGDLRSEIHSIDLWVDFEFDTNPQFTLTLEGISIVKVLPEIVKFLNNPQSFVKSGVKNLQLQENDENASRLSDLEGKYKRARSAEKKEQIKGQIERLKAAVAQDEKAKLESDNISVDDLNLDVFKSIELYTIQVAKKKSNSLIVSGQSGVGKTQTVKDTLKSLGMVTDVDYFTTTGTITTAGLYEVLFKNRHKLIVFDDCDAVFKESDSINLLKGALDTYEVREISKMTKGNTFDSMGMSDEEIEATYQEDPSKLPNKFGFNGQVIFISNLPEDKFDDALLSRSLHVDVHLNKSELIERMKTLMHKISPELDDELKQEALDYLIYVTETYPVKFDLNIRTLIHSINLRAGNDEDITIGERSEKVWKLLIKKYLVKAKRKI